MRRSGPYRLFFLVRVLLLCIPLGLLLGFWWALDRYGGIQGILEQLLTEHDSRIARSEAELNRDLMGIQRRLSGMSPLTSQDERIEAAAELAALGLARRKSFQVEGLSVAWGQPAAEAIWINQDNSDLHQLVPALMVAVKDADPRLRLEAAYALSHMQLERRHQDLQRDLSRLLDGEVFPAVQAYLARALGDIGPAAGDAAADIAPLVLHDDPRVAANAAHALARMGAAAYSLERERILLAGLERPEPRVREHVAEALGAVGAYSARAERALLERLADPDPFVRVTAALALTELGVRDEAVLKVLAEAFELPPKSQLYVEDFVRDRMTKRRAADVFGALRRVPDSAVDSVLAFVRSSDDLLRKEAAIEALVGDGRFSRRRAEALVSLLPEPRLMAQHAVVDGLVAMGPDVGEYVTPLLQHQSDQVRKLAASVLARIGYRDPGAEDALAANLDSPNADVRVQSIKALVSSSADREGTIDLLLETLAGDPVQVVRIAALDALATLASPRSFDAVLPWADHEVPKLARAATVALLAADAARAEAGDLVEERLTRGDYDVIDAILAVRGRAAPLTPVLIRAFEAEDDRYRRQRLVDAMVVTGDPAALAFIRDHSEERVLNGPIKGVAVARLLLGMTFPSGAPVDEERRRQDLLSLVALGVITESDGAAFLADIQAPDLVQRIRARIRELDPPKPREPSLHDRVRAHYADLPEPQSDAVAVAIERLRSADQATRLAGIKELRQVLSHSVEAPTVIRRALKDPDDRIVAAAMNAYYEAGADADGDVPLLLDVLKAEHRSSLTNDLAAASLARLGALEQLLEASEQEAVEVRRAATFGLLELGPLAARARDRLEALAADPHPGVSAYARKALEALGDES